MNDITTDLAQVLERHKGEDLFPDFYSFEVAEELYEYLVTMGVVK